MHQDPIDRTTIFVSILALVSVASAAYLAYEQRSLQSAHAILQTELQQTKLTAGNTELALSTKIQQLEEQVTQLGGDLESEREENEELNENLDKEKNRNDEFEDQIDDLSDTLDILDKLSKTDEELLQKYSKVSFLNEHYEPEALKEIDKEWKYSEEKPNKLHKKVMPFLEDMLEDAKDNEVDLWVISAYRSFEHQAHLKGAYTVTYGSGANAFSADQGFSEHQLGTTVDFTTSGIGGGLAGFGNTEAFKWLEKNAHKYGFVLSYPEGNQYYVYEPWHWRFVGKDLAEDLHDDEKHFYDLDQREIDEYLIKIFD